MQKDNRRSFIKQAGTASALALGGFVNLNSQALGANERVILALIGGRNQGRNDALDAVKQGAVFKTFCDIDDAILKKVGGDLQKAQERAPGFEKDYRKVLEDKEIDGVLIAVPDHWHAIQTIDACKAGKDVYIEKPLSHTIHEGHKMVEAARKYNRIVQMGTQRRSDKAFAAAVKFAVSGKLGKICLMKAWECQVRGDLGNPPDAPVPAGVDYDRWLGPAPLRPFNPQRFHYNWRFFWDYCNTELGNQGVHMLDILLWALAEMRGLQNCLPKRISGCGGIYWLKDAKEVPDTQVLTYDYGDFLMTWELHSFEAHSPLEGETSGIGFYGTEASLISTKNGWTIFYKNGQEPLKIEEEGGSHTGNFIECIKSRQRPHSEVEIGRVSTTICHLGNICQRLGRDVQFDPKTETFGDDKEANALLTKEYRKPYILPEV